MNSRLLLGAIGGFSLLIMHCGPANPSSGQGSASTGEVGGTAGAAGNGGGGGGGGAGGGCVPLVSESIAGFQRYAVDAAADGPAYVSIGDIDGDGRKDLVVSNIGPVIHDDTTGAITLSRARINLYRRLSDGFDCWEKTPILTDSEKFYFPGQSTLEDIDGDGDLDIFAPFGFFVCQFDSQIGGPCGALAWFENQGGSFVRHDIVPFGHDHFFHKAKFIDIDGDGIKDLVTVGEAFSGPKAQWFKGTKTADRFDTTAHPIGDGLGSFPEVLDIDGDGDLDLASAEFFVTNGSFAWFEQTEAPSMVNPNGTWVRHVINDDSSKSIQLSMVPNLYGDGLTRAVGTNHTNVNKMPPDTVESAVFAFDIPNDPTLPWPKKVISSGIVCRPNMGVAMQGAPGVFGYGDIDGDNDIDLAVSGDGDVHTYWLEQTAPGEFATHVLEEQLGQAGGGHVVDIDGDGRNEVVFTGYEDNRVYVYTRP